MEREQDLQRLLQIEKNWNFYRGDQVHYLKDEDTAFIRRRAELNQDEVDAILAKIRVPLNYTRLVVDRYINGCYGLEVARSVTDQDNQAVLNDIWRQNRIQHFMMNVQRVAEIEGMCAVIPRWKEDQQQIVYEKYGAQHLIPIERPDDPTRLAGLILSWNAENKWGLVPDIVENNLPGTRNVWKYNWSGKSVNKKDTGKFGPQKYIEIWTDDWVQAYLGKEEIANADNPYGEIPFAFFRAGEDDGTFWGQTSITDVVALNHVINRLLSDLIEVIRVHGFSLLFISGDMTDQLILKPHSFIKAPEEGDAKFLTPNSPIREIQDFIDWFIKRLSDVGQVPEATITGGKYEESGFALTIRWLPYTQMLQTKRLIYAEAEKELIRKTLLVSAVHTGRGNPSLWDSSIDFLDEGFVPQHGGERLQYNAFLLANNVINPTDLMKKEFPDLTEEQITERLIANIRINSALKQALGATGQDVEGYISSLKAPTSVEPVKQVIEEEKLTARGVKVENDPLPLDGNVNRKKNNLG